jgi:hypothetical protein
MVGQLDHDALVGWQAAPDVPPHGSSQAISMPEAKMLVRVRLAKFAPCAHPAHPPRPLQILRSAWGIGINREKLGKNWGRSEQVKPGELYATKLCINGSLPRPREWRKKCMI